MVDSDDLLFRPYAPGYGIEWLETTSGTQSIIFYGDFLPALYQMSVATKLGNTSILDIGPASCAGTAFLDNAMNKLLGWPVNFTAIDHVPDYERYVRKKYPRINYIVGNVLDPRYQGAYDVVICSHALEHIPDPAAFVAACNDIARKFCLFYTPYCERNLIPGHINSIDDKFITSLPRVVWSCVKRSAGWRPASDPNPHTILFVTVAAANGKVSDHRSLASLLHDEYSVRSTPIQADASTEPTDST
jgi:SAM-dependent methyltransferase